jgi:hypothetical protein
MMAEATDGKEAADAVARSRRRLNAVRAREPWTARVTHRLALHLERNHFAEILGEAYGEDPKGQDP